MKFDSFLFHPATRTYHIPYVLPPAERPQIWPVPFAYCLTSDVGAIIDRPRSEMLRIRITAGAIVT